VLLVYIRRRKQNTTYTSVCSYNTADTENAPHLITVHYSKYSRQYISSKTNYP